MSLSFLLVIVVLVVVAVAKSLLWTLWTRVWVGRDRDMEARGLNEGMSGGQEGANIPPVSTTLDHQSRNNIWKYKYTVLKYVPEFLGTSGP